MYAEPFIIFLVSTHFL
jgi:hypothetical protein